MSTDFDSLRLMSGQVFTPGAPVNERDLFAGRLDQLNRIIEALSQRGYHSVLYGERGVGKTSLANILVTHLSQYGYVIARANCDAGDTFTSIWRKAFTDINFNRPVTGPGFLAKPEISVENIAQRLPAVVNPDDVRRLMTDLSRHVRVLVILDEYDRIADRQVATLVSDTIKALSDFGVPASLLLIGVANSVDDLIEGHRSIERALVQIPMPRMSNDEIGQILATGVARLGMTMDEAARSHVVSLSQGLPYIAHLLALHSVSSAITDGST